MFVLRQSKAGTLFVEQNVLLRKLPDALKSILNISAVTRMNMLLYAEAGDVLSQCVFGSQSVIIREKDVLMFIEDCSIESSNDLSGLDSDTRGTVLQTVSEIKLQTFMKVSSLEVERDLNNAPAENLLLPVLPIQL